MGGNRARSASPVAGFRRGSVFATRTEFLAVAVVLSSLYPVVPVLLGITALRERLRRRQILGLVGALAASVLIATS
jgi:drug/metabolite transporter (DMT)-like permease